MPLYKSISLATEISQQTSIWEVNNVDGEDTALQTSKNKNHTAERTNRGSSIIAAESNLRKNRDGLSNGRSTSLLHMEAATSCLHFPFIAFTREKKELDHDEKPQRAGNAQGTAIQGRRIWSGLLIICLFGLWVFYGPGEISDARLIWTEVVGIWKDKIPQTKEPQATASRGLLWSQV